MMGDVSPKACRASYKHGIINFDTLLHLVGYFCMNRTMMQGSTNIKPVNVFFIMLCGIYVCLECNISSEQYVYNF